ncbi:EF-hand domain-containing protein [Sulfidibacter corallicola]|uniref:EF-hand domain-containing protein n=1 Tax=Sulfidibacter corallicola TaxID=2818388 RepID=A0A8A4TLL1_SULCO|nr:EF-hand domain-containing protein [Sulfidibacter corallicola]QTD50094.1 EF-hand domain-containing protein [Sulfidibacter corallicola]
MKKMMILALIAMISTIAFAQRKGYADYGSKERREGRRHNPGFHLIRIADSDRDGQVTQDEWSTLVAGLQNEAGTLTNESIVEFLEAHRSRQGESGDGQRDSGRRPSPPADAFDFDHNGVLEVADLTHVFGEVDRNGDGVIDRDEMPRPPRRSAKRR